MHHVFCLYTWLSGTYIPVKRILKWTGSYYIKGQENWWPRSPKLLLTNFTKSNVITRDIDMNNEIHNKFSLLYWNINLNVWKCFWNFNENRRKTGFRLFNYHFLPIFLYIMIIFCIIIIKLYDKIKIFWFILFKAKIPIFTNLSIKIV